MALESAHLGCPWILGGGGALPSRIHYAVVVPGWALACPGGHTGGVLGVYNARMLLEGVNDGDWRSDVGVVAPTFVQSD